MRFEGASIRIRRDMLVEAVSTVKGDPPLGPCRWFCSLLKLTNSIHPYDND
jgi:hypothetical protein